ncbi:PIN domain-containing protein [Cellulomonas composti]|uniref:PIN domain-containing protein n=1 Tax=Cellulomonas composti TaxID=266130 RepID=A0A511JBP2_9CELL|nr:PIN domain-containing protein [Cellulomonas composti]GEL95415.1 hypothetical protein CCO02nite_20730 [Cellulomonas composti]
MTRPAVDRPRVYADGSALSRYLAGAPGGDQWRAWADEHEADLVVSPLSLTELRGTARWRDRTARDVAQSVGERLELVRFSDQAILRATDVASVLPPFTALHLGTALAHRDVTTVATYEVHLARVAALHGLVVLSPGRPERWWERDTTPWVRG